MIKRALVFLIRGYQKYISPLLGDHCRFVPSCSQYTLEAIETRGVLMGLLLGFFRILRCNPLFKGGYDPVPQRPARLK
ncbi:MAG: membrane protein insertion efficiency factor YidD [Oscillospiraceae bacterium]|nr:membrane protein insertion efficiency factor YidD [Oscillospiraceae bacterium]